MVPFSRALDILTLCKLITVLIRHDRFCVGFLVGAFERRVVLRILEAINARLSKNE